MLEDKKIAVVAMDGFEQSELLTPKQMLEKAGAKVEIISIEKKKIRSWKNGDWGKSVHIDLAIENAAPLDYDAIILPGGVMNADQLRTQRSVIHFIKRFAKLDRPIAAICHAPWLLIEAELVENRTLTSWPSLRTDLENAGARWMDGNVVSDGNLITSRKPSDLLAFNGKIIQYLTEGPIAAMKRASSQIMKKEKQSLLLTL